MIDVSYIDAYTNIPRRKNLFLKILARVYFFFFRWKTQGEIPDVKKGIVIVAPHTSNWDFVHLLFFSFLIEVKVSWFGKHTIFRKPFGRLFKYFGGVPVDRSKHHSFVEKMIEEFEKRERFILALSPEGTRNPVKNWKSGFYFIAKRLSIPVVLLGLDYKDKTINFLPPIYFDDNVSKEEAIEKVKNLFSKFNAKYPEKFVY